MSALTPDNPRFCRFRGGPCTNDDCAKALAQMGLPGCEYALTWVTDDVIKPDGLEGTEGLKVLKQEELSLTLPEGSLQPTAPATWRVIKKHRAELQAWLLY